MKRRPVSAMASGLTWEDVLKDTSFKLHSKQLRTLLSSSYFFPSVWREKMSSDILAQC